MPLIKSKSRDPFSSFDLNEADLQTQNVIKNQSSSFKMDFENRSDADNKSMSSEEEPPRDIKLIKRVTMINMANMYMGPKLFRCNSGIDIEQ